MIAKTLDVQKDILLKTIRKLGDNSKESYVIVDATDNHRVIECSDSFCELTNSTRLKLLNRDYFSMLSNGLQMTTIEMMKKNIHIGTMVKARLHHNCVSKAPFWAEIQALPFQNNNNETQYVLFLVKDVTYYHTEDFLIGLEKAIYEAIEKDNTFQKNMTIICNGVDEFFMPNVSSMILTKTESNKFQVFMANHKDSDIPELCTINEFYSKAMQAEEFILAENIAEVDIPIEHKHFVYSLERRSGLFIPIRNQKQYCIGLFVIFYEPTMNDRAFFIDIFRKIGSLVALEHVYSKTQQKIWDLAYMDITTGLPNRHSFIDRLEKIQKQGQNGFVKIIAPSEFRQVVELYGREAGDELLRQLARRFIENKNEKNEHIARFTSSSLIISRAISIEEMMNYEERINELIRQPFIIGDKRLYITLKTGISSFNEEIKIVDAIRFADNALSYASSKPGTHTELFTKERNDELEQQMTVLHHLSYALKNKEISVDLQPKVDLLSGEIQSIEALARWFSPTLGSVSPAIFVPVAENAGKVREIDTHILEQVLTWLAERKRLGKKLVKVAVNISPNHFYYPHFVEDTLKLVQKYGINPSYIIVEVTENIGLVDFKTAVAIIQELKGYGFKTSVDDFGIGFSSLSYLQRLPFAEIKIDRSFIHDIQDAGTLAIVRSIIQLALNLGMTSVAEGIENEKQVEILRTLGCTIGQGFFYYKPMSIEQLDAVLDI